MTLAKTMIIGVIASMAALAVAACGSSNDSSTSSASTTAAAATDACPGFANAAQSSSSGPPAPGASVSFTEPTDGSDVSGPVTAKVDIKGFKLNAAAVGKPPVEGEGHLHFAVDDGQYDCAKYSGANGKLAEQLGVDGQYSPATEPTITYTGLPSGSHTLEVYLANNDHSNTGVEDSVTFNVK